MSKRKSKTQDLVVNFVLDKSGSMYGSREATLEGFNSFLNEQRQREGKTYLSLTLFSTTFEVRHVALDVLETPDLGSDESPYQPGGGTALYDAVVTTIHGTDAWLVKHPEFKGRVLCVIQTDGGENSSVENSLATVNNLMEAKQAEGWEFAFMGAGQAAWTEGQKFTAIPQSQVFAYTGGTASTAKSFSAMTNSVSNYVIGNTMANTTYSGVATDDEE